MNLSEKGFFNPEDWSPKIEMQTSPKPEMPIFEVFASAGLPLSQTERDMLSEGVEHRYIPETAENNRKGSGFLQATREIARTMRSERKKGDVRLMIERPLLTHILPRLIELKPDINQLMEIKAKAERLLQDLNNIEKALFQAKEMQKSEYINPTDNRQDVENYLQTTINNYYDVVYELDRLQDELRDIIEGLSEERIPESWWQVSVKSLESIRTNLAGLSEGERLVGGMLVDLFDPNVETSQLLTLPSLKETQQVGTCTTAEIYFLDAVTHNVGYKEPDIIVDESENPVMILKNAGERSAITLRETVLDGVRLPKGSLVQVGEYSQKSGRDRLIPLASMQGFKFLRLTSLAVSPQGRKEAIGSLYDFQKSQGMKGFDTVTIDDLVAVAEQKIKSIMA